MRIFTFLPLYITILSISTILLFAGSKAPADNTKATTGGELSFTVRTVSANGTYSPKHVLAIWIEDVDGFVKSRKVMAAQRIQYLYTWVASSNYNVVDAITGATLQNHQTHTVTWDCTDLDGEIVPDGEYTIWTEFTDAHAQGPVFTGTFTKGPDPQLIIPPDEIYFKDMVISFTPYVSDFSADHTEVCMSEAVVFTDQSVNATSWEWNFGADAYPATANTQGPHTVHYAYPGLNTVSLTINGSVTEKKENYISVATAPLAGFAFSGQGYSVDFMSMSQNAISFLWDFGDGNTSTEENPTHVYQDAGTYVVSLTTINGYCEDMVSNEVTVPLVGINEISAGSQVKVYPNPGNGIFYVESSDDRIESIQLIDISGKKTRTTVVEMGTQKVSVSVEGSVPGIYFLEVKTSSKTYLRKLFLY